MHTKHAYRFIFTGEKVQRIQYVDVESAIPFLPHAEQQHLYEIHINKIQILCWENQQSIPQNTAQLGTAHCHRHKTVPNRESYQI